MNSPVSYNLNNILTPESARVEIVTSKPAYENIKIIDQDKSTINRWFSQAINTYSFYEANLTLDRMSSLLTDPQNPHRYRKIVSMHPSLGQPVFLIGDRELGNRLLSLQRNRREDDKNGKQLISGGHLIDVFHKIMGSNILTCSAERNQQYRKVFKPVLLSPEKKYAVSLQDVTTQLIDNWMSRNESINLSKEIPKFAAAAVAKNILGYEGPMAEISQAITALAKRLRSEIFYIPSWLGVDITKAKDTIGNAFLNVKDKQNNLLASMKASNIEKKFSDEEIESTAEMMFFGGQDTSASLMIWALSQLGRISELQEILYHEWRKAEKGGTSMTDHLASEKTLLHAILQELLRLHPPTFVQPRQTEECYLNDQETRESIFIPQGSMLLIANYFINRDERYYPDPEKLNPTRFLFKEGQELPPNPNGFSVGPNMCLGQFFAKLEIKTFMLLLILKCRWTCLNKDFTQVTKSVLWMKDEIEIQLEPRKVKEGQ